MSASLLRKGLELLAPEPTGNKQKGVKKGTIPRSLQSQLLRSDKTGVRKQLRRMRQQGKQQNQRATAKGRTVTSAIEEYKKHSEKDHLAQNLKYMLNPQSVANKDTVQKILKQNCGRRARDQRVSKEPKKAAEPSAFTDADFKRFEKEYFGGK
ncbi:active regulator of SIRT1 [Bombina bombina]|uniref:active regulator of SIRT1 n=1 Tax=Bombina bombina TaxID=8345 RepID=UPI00235A84C8|nr:active regulator of SIRT1 [Bombina bombina]